MSPYVGEADYYHLTIPIVHHSFITCVGYERAFELLRFNRLGGSARQYSGKSIGYRAGFAGAVPRLCCLSRGVAMAMRSVSSILQGFFKPYIQPYTSVPYLSVFKIVVI